MRHLRDARIIFVISFSFTFLIATTDISADMSIVQQGSRGRGSPKETWTRTIRIKGLKMRVEFTGGSEPHTIIYDLEAGKGYRLDPKKKQAFVLDLASESKQLKGTIIPQSLRRTIESTGKKAEIEGIPCDEYTFDLQVRTRPWRGMSSVLHDSGTVCVSQTIPAGAEFTNFVHEAKKRGYDTVAVMCSPTPSTIGPYFYGDEPNVIVLSFKIESAYEGGLGLGLDAMSRYQSNMTVTSINGDQIREEALQVPPDWKMKKGSEFNW